jgi:hypothetical protein
MEEGYAGGLCGSKEEKEVSKFQSFRVSKWVRGKCTKLRGDSPQRHGGTEKEGKA